MQQQTHVARRPRLLAAALALAVTVIGCGSDDDTSDSSAQTSTSAPAASDTGDTAVDDTEVDDTQPDDGEAAGSAGNERVVNLVTASSPVLTADEATCVAAVIVESLGDAAPVITGAPATSPLQAIQIAELTMQTAAGGTGTSVEQNAAGVSECVADPVSFSGSPTPPSGEVATCANATLAGTPEYQTYTGEFRFLGTYYDRASGFIDTRGGGVEVAEPTSALLVGACAG
jgi:hypothetical protein